MNNLPRAFVSAATLLALCASPGGEVRALTPYYKPNQGADQPNITAVTKEERVDTQFSLGASESDGQHLANISAHARAGNPRAQYLLGMLYADGEGGSRDGRQALSWFRKAARQGFADAQYELGLRYENGSGVSKNLQTATQYYRQAAQQGHVQAQTKLGASYFAGKGVTRDKQQAADWFQQAARQGGAAAQFNLALMYAQGMGVEKDQQQAVAWYSKAAAQGFISGEYGLGAIYGRGFGFPKELQQAISFYRQAVQRGEANADNEIALILLYETRERALEKEFQSADWYYQAALQGGSDGQFLLGNAYLNGTRIARDVQLAYFWLSLAAAQGDSVARYTLSELEALLTAEQKNKIQAEAAAWQALKRPSGQDGAGANAAK